MGIPALAELGRMTGDRRVFRRCVEQIELMSAKLFNAQVGLYAHGFNAHNPDAPQFYWGRATGWIVIRDVRRARRAAQGSSVAREVLTQLRATLKGVAQYQSGSGLWHQMVDRNDSYLETSRARCSSTGIAHAVNEGWVNPTTYGSTRRPAWCGLARKINAQGQVEGSCVGTTFAGDQVLHYNRR